MPRHDYKFCKSCGRSRDEAGSMSRTRLCVDCAGRRLERNIRGISSQTGPAFVRQLVGISKYIETAGARALAQSPPDGHTP